MVSFETKKKVLIFWCKPPFKIMDISFILTFQMKSQKISPSDFGGTPELTYPNVYIEQ